MPYDPEKKVFITRTPADLYEAAAVIMGLGQALQLALVELTVAKGVADTAWLDELQANALREVKGNITSEDVSIERQAEAGRLAVDIVDNFFNQARRHIEAL